MTQSPSVTAGSSAESNRGTTHKAAIALNNAATSLLVRGFYQEALDTSKDAMKLIRSVVSIAEASTIEGEIALNEIRPALDRAYQQTARSFRTMSQDKVYKHHPTLHVISSQENSSSRCVELVSCAHRSPTHVAFPMTIDPIDFEECDDPEIEFHSIVIIYNFGIGYACQSRADGVVEACLQGKTNRIFGMTSALISRMFQNVWGHASPCFAGRLLLMTSLSTHNILQACVQQNLPMEYHAHRASMRELLGLWEFQQRLLPQTKPHLAAAA